jgi:hypothetical protein
LVLWKNDHIGQLTACLRLVDSYCQFWSVMIHLVILLPEGNLWKTWQLLRKAAVFWQFCSLRKLFKGSNLFFYFKRPLSWTSVVYHSITKLFWIGTRFHLFVSGIPEHQWLEIPITQTDFEKSHWYSPVLDFFTYQPILTICCRKGWFMIL